MACATFVRSSRSLREKACEPCAFGLVQARTNAGIDHARKAGNWIARISWCIFYFRSKRCRACLPVIIIACCSSCAERRKLPCLSLRGIGEAQPSSVGNQLTLVKLISISIARIPAGDRAQVFVTERGRSEIAVQSATIKSCFMIALCTRRRRNQVTARHEVIARASGALKRIGVSISRNYFPKYLRTDW